MAEILGQRSGTAWAGRTGKHKHRALQSRVQSSRHGVQSMQSMRDPHWPARLSATPLAILTKFESQTGSLCKFRVTNYRAEYVFFMWRFLENLSQSDTDQAVPIVSLKFLSGTILTLFWVDRKHSLQPNWSQRNAIFQSHKETCIDKTSFNFDFKIFGTLR